MALCRALFGYLKVRGGLMSWFVVVCGGSWWFVVVRGGSWWFNVMVRGGL